MVWGVRSRITALAALVVAVVLTLTALALVAGQRRVLTDSIDEVLQRRATEISLDLQAGTLGDPISGSGDEESFAEVSDPAGRVIASTPFLPQGLPPADRDGTVTARLTVDGADTEYRVATIPSGEAAIRVGTPLDDVSDSVDALLRMLAIAVPLAVLILAALVWWLVGRVLRPVERIRREVTEVGGGSLDRRVPVPAGRDEIARLARTMNDMLDRLESSAERQRRFTADASHELRSPLARMRAELEVELSQPQPADIATTRRSLLEETEALQRLVDDLLLLARSDGGSPAPRQTVDLDDIVLEEVRRIHVGGVVALNVSAVSAAQVTGNPGQLRRVVRNLLENAAQGGGSLVKVRLTENAGEAVLEISDDGRGIPADTQERVFERFARVDEARTSALGGTGLGLAICRELVHAHGGSIAFDPGHTPGARIVVRLPQAGEEMH